MNWTVFPRTDHYPNCKGHCNNQGFIIYTKRMDEDLLE